MRPPIFATIFALAIGFLLAPLSSESDAQFRRRIACQSNYCPPAHDDVDVIKLDVLDQVDLLSALVGQNQNSQAIVIQNNYNGEPLNLGSTLYGYAADPLRSPLTAQPLAYNPYQINPDSMMREAERLASRVGDLHQQAVTSYTQLGTLALQTGSQADTIRAQTEQLRAQAELIRAAAPQALPPAQVVAPLVAPQTAANVQRLTSGSQTICIEPDGRGGFTIRIDGATVAESGHDSSQQTSQQTSQKPSPAGQPQTDSETPRAVLLMKQRCASCHTGTASKGGVVMFEDANTFLMPDRVLSERILESVRSGAMPEAPEGVQPVLLTANEIAELQLFLGGQ